ncbi:MAG: DUF3574 domain-containing protein [Methylobacter sp.]|nr:DUF3574 domain-containing protein [Methylobacter sp.]
MNHMRYIIVCIFLATGIVLNTASARDSAAEQIRSRIFSEIPFCKHTLHGEIFHRTELFFGLSRSNGPDVTETEFQNFIDTKVTPRFPDGLTLVSALGQFKDSTGAIIQEGSKLLILLYPFSKESNRDVEQIREDYKADFQQESVLRVDEQTCVSF